MTLFSERLEKAARRAHGSRLQRFRMAPLRMTRSVALEFFSSTLVPSFRKRARTFWGGRLWVVLPEYVSMCVDRYAFFEEELTRFLVSRLQPGMTFFDIGAHIGYFSALAAVLVGASGEVHAFEPTPRTFALLERNLAGRPQVRLNRMALHSERTRLSLVDFGPRWSSFNSVALPRLGPKARGRSRPCRLTVEAVSLDEYIAATAASPQVIKIDAENAEPDILRGAHRTLEAYRPLVLLEAGDATATGREKTQDILSAMAVRGYRPFSILAGACVPYEHSARAVSPEILAFRAQEE